jgi:hypothetical protein
MPSFVCYACLLPFDQLTQFGHPRILGVRVRAKVQTCDITFLCVSCLFKVHMVLTFGVDWVRMPCFEGPACLMPFDQLT